MCCSNEQVLCSIWYILLRCNIFPVREYFHLFAHFLGKSSRSGNFFICLINKALNGLWTHLWVLMTYVCMIFYWNFMHLQRFFWEVLSDMCILFADFRTYRYHIFLWWWILWQLAHKTMHFCASSIAAAYRPSLTSLLTRFSFSLGSTWWKSKAAGWEKLHCEHLRVLLNKDHLAFPTALFTVFAASILALFFR